MERPDEYEEKWISKHLNLETIKVLEDFALELEETQNSFHLPVDFEQFGNAFMEKHSLKMGKFGQPVRIALIGKSAGVSINDIMAVIGKNEVLIRIQNAIRELKSCLQG